MTDPSLKALDAIVRELQILSGYVSQNSGYLARQEIQQLKRSLEHSPRRLEHYGFKVYSQNDEDGIIEEIFARIGTTKGTFCEIGVENGLECNSLYLLHKGWRGAWLEGNPAQQQAIEQRFGSLMKHKRLGLGVGMIGPGNLQSAIERTFSALGLDLADMDFLSIDIDGMDIYLLEALPCRPKALCVEYNAKFPPPLNKRPVFDPAYRWRGTDYMGASLVALAEAAKDKGYSLVGTNLTGANAFFVRDDLLGGGFEPPFTAEALYNPPRYYLWANHYRSSIGHPAGFGPYTDLGE